MLGLLNLSIIKKHGSKRACSSKSKEFIMVLKKIQDFLEKKDYSCSLFPSSEKLPYDHLLVFLGLDVKKRERLLEILATQQPILPESTLSQNQSLTPYRIQFRISLPFKVQDTALTQVASLILFLNPFIDLPGFELDELNGQVAYRYVWIINADSIDETLISSIMGTLTLNVNLFSETIESLADGTMSFNDLLAQIISLIEHSKKNTSPS